MASTASDLIKFEKQTTGENDGTWGTLANKAMSRLEEAMHDITDISLNALSGANYTLDDTQYEEHNNAGNSQESHVAAIKATGTLNANEVILVPARNHIYWIWNATSGSYTVTVNISGGAGIEVPQGYLAAVLADGTNVEALTPPVSAAGAMTMYGRELFLDVDGDTSITADTDDQIDFRIAGADDFQITANTLSVLSGTTLNIDSGATIANSGTATGFGQAQGDVLDDLNTTGANSAADEVLVGTGAGALSWESGNDLIDSISQDSTRIIGGINVTEYNATGDGTVYNPDWDSNSEDRNNDLSGTTVTIPKAGVYLIGAVFDCSGVTTGQTTTKLNVVTSVKTVDIYEGGENKSAGNITAISGFALMEMAAAETFVIAIMMDGGSKVVDFHSGQSGCHLYVAYLG